MISAQVVALCGVGLLSSVVLAQTPPGFVPEVSSYLQLSYGESMVSPAGMQLPMTDVRTPPKISVGAANGTNQPIIPSNLNNTNNQTPSTGLLVMMDLDVPRNNTRNILLHWLAPNVQLTTSPATIPTDQGAPYVSPSPPAGDLAHRYVFLLFAQPDGFTIPPAFSTVNPPASGSARFGFDLAAFAAQGGLGSPMMANYIMVRNANASAVSTSFPPIITGTQGTNGTLFTTSTLLSTSSLGEGASSTEGSSASSTSALNLASATSTASASDLNIPVGLGLLAWLVATFV